MNTPEKLQDRYKRAKKRVEDEKGFYNHLTVYIVINILIICVNRFIYTNNDNAFTDKGFIDWLNWNLLATPVLWGIGLLIHGVRVFKKKTYLSTIFKKSIFGSEWEKQKIKELMDKEDF